MSNSDQPRSPGVILKSGRRLTTLDEWHCYAPPKDKRKHWKDGRSAKESARVWLDSAPDLPSEISDVLYSCNDVGPLRAWYAEPEAKVRFDEFRGEPPNIDVLLIGHDEYGPIVVAVEAKADETFGTTIEKTLSDANARLETKPESKGVARIQQLTELFGLTLERDVLKLRYQLMTITAAVLAEAERRAAQRAIVIIHEFVTPLTITEKQARNGRDLDRFMERLFGQKVSLRHGMLMGPFESSRGPVLYFGKAQTIA